MDPISILIQVLISISMMTVGSLLANASLGSPEEVTDWEDPTATEVRPIPYAVGLVRISGINLLWYGEKSVKRRYVDAKDR